MLLLYNVIQLQTVVNIRVDNQRKDREADEGTERERGSVCGGRGREGEWEEGREGRGC